MVWFITIKFQVTFIQLEKIKYIYQPVDDIYVVLITSINSNIVEDTQILQCIVSVLSQRLDGITEAKICSDVFVITDIISEFCNFDGTCEKLTSSDVEQNLAMQSQEEELYFLELKQKKNDAKKLAQQKASELSAEKKSREKMEKQKGKEQRAIDEKYQEIQRIQQEEMIKMQEEEERRRIEKEKKKETIKMKKGGITLGKQKKILFDEEEEKNVLNNEDNSASQEEEQQQPNQEKKVIKEKKLMTENMIIKLIENVSCSMYSENSTCSLSLAGSLSVSVADASLTHTPITINHYELPLKTQLHPQMDTTAFNKDHILIPKTNAKGYAIGSTPSLLIKWSYTSTDNESLPISVTCWPSEEEDHLSMTISYETKKQLNNLRIIVPVKENVIVDSCEGTYNTEDGLEWIIGNVEQGSTGAMEFTLNDNNLRTDDMFPVKIEFDVDQTYSGLKINEIKLDSVDTSIQCTTDFKVFP
ncbi:coatomer subunit delta-1, putative [Entamoeba dispar SAW760]|uniref:Coatomer subunit delta n=1 Tax=Entamoeba dispar (strain ATCC PRA-260 / SAW760) TaxID=370354 RepID=B0E621_ENTDS|nr:coatomer subunit delta-1, putative [Entamoeba dispar SAW760]EDR29994.1 coatomer subunit delta-1, putative [Entamoeba dispar SAW760]|eukprot:EDR29994.1 coatomer subunit delta-1, putative [Entamoeba dispar SAW760]